MKYYDPSIDMTVHEVETRKGFISCVKRIHSKHYAEKWPYLHFMEDKDADTIECIGFKSKEEFLAWGRKGGRIIYSQHIGAWEGYGDGYGKGTVYSPCLTV
jgi:hypothetical protein